MKFSTKIIFVSIVMISMMVIPAWQAHANRLNIITPL